MDLAAEVYKLAKLMPKTEEFRLTSQLLRAAASVPSNIAEGNARGTRKDYANFVSIARGSLAETETLLILAVRTGLLAEDKASVAMKMADDLGRQLNVLRQRLSAQPAASRSANPNP
jgi:four helix bundle protein